MGVPFRFLCWVRPDDERRPWRVSRPVEALDDDLAAEVRRRRDNVAYVARHRHDNADVAECWAAVKAEVGARKQARPTQAHNLELVGNRLRIHFRAFAELALHRHNSRLLDTIKNLRGLSPSYFAVNQGVWHDCQALAAQQLLTISPTALKAIEAVLQDAAIRTCPLYPIKPQQRLGYLTDIEQIECSVSDRARGLIAGQFYSIEARSRVQTERGERPRQKLNGDIALERYSRARKVLEISIALDEHNDLCLSEADEDIQYLVRHFAIPDPGDLGTRYPDLVAREQARLDALAQAHGFAFRDFQREDLARLLVKGGGVLAHEQGLGKTLSAMAFAATIGNRNPKSRPALFIVPQDLVPQWKREAQRFFGRDLVEIDGIPTAARVARMLRDQPATDTWFITWFEALSRNGRLEELDEHTTFGTGQTRERYDRRTGEIVEQEVVLSSKEFCPRCRASLQDGYNGKTCACGFHRYNRRIKPAYAHLTTCFRRGTVVIDEGTKIKADDSLMSLAVRGLRCRHRLLLTGTPVKNFIPDAFWLLWWGLGNNTPRFPYTFHGGKTKFVEDFAVIETLFAEDGKKKRAKVLPEVTNLAMLWRLLSSSIIRRRKEETGETLPPRTFHEVYVPFGTAQKEQYGQWLSQFTDWYLSTHDTEMSGAMVELMSAILGLYWKLQFTCTLPDKQSENSWFRSPHTTPKLLATVQQALECVERGEQVVVFSSLMEHGPVVARLLNMVGVKAAHIVQEGQAKPTTKNPRQRADLVNEFRAGKFDVLCAGITAMNLGHNLDNASSVIISGLPWDYATFDQAIARVHRLTSKKPVHVYVVLVQGSLDDKMWQLIQDKEAAACLALDGRLFEQTHEPVDQQKFLKALRQSWHQDQQAPTIAEADVAQQLQQLRRGNRPALIATPPAPSSPRPTPHVGTGKTVVQTFLFDAQPSAKPAPSAPRRSNGVVRNKGQSGQTPFLW